MPNPAERTTAEKLLRPIQVRSLLGVCAATVWNYTRAGLLKPVQHTAGGHARYRESDVMDLRTKLTGPAEAAA